MKNYAYPDEFIKHGEVEKLEKIYGLDEDSIVKEIIRERETYEQIATIK